MFSKRYVFIFMLWLMVLIGLSGCNMHVGEEPPPTINPKLTGTQCLSGVMVTAKDFIQGQAQDQDLVAGWDCLSGAVEKFNKYVRGRSEDRYDIQELSTFLEKNFFEKQNPKKISPDLQLELMRIKKLFLGGSLTQITRLELEQTKETFKNFKNLTLKINPYMQIATFHWKPGEPLTLKKDQPFFDQANLAFQMVAKELGGMIQVKNESYDLDNANQFFIQLSKFYNEKWPFLEEMPHYLGLIKKVKKTLAGGSEFTIASEEWKKFLNLGARSYFQYLRYFYFLKDVTNLTQSERFSYIAKTVEDLFGIIHELVIKKEKNYIDKTEVHETLTKLSEVWPIFKVSKGLIDQLMKIKQLLVGGDDQRWTMEDIESAKSTVDSYRNIIDKLYPYFSFITLDEDPKNQSFSEQLKYFSTFKSDMNSVAVELGVLLKSDYRYSDLVNLAHEFDQLYPSIAPNLPIATSLLKFQNLFETVKKISFQNNGNTVLKEEWNSLLKMAVQFGTSFLFYHYYFEPYQEPVQTHSKILRYQALVDELFQSLSNYFVLKKNQCLEFEESWALVTSLKSIGWIPTELKKESLHKIFYILAQNLLISREDRLSGHVPDRIDLKSFRYLKTEYIDPWYLLENKYSLFFDQKNKLTKVDVLKALEDEEHKLESHNSTVRNSIQEFHSILKIKTNLNYDSRFQMIISGEKEDVYDYPSLNILNSTRMLSKWMLNSFSNSQSPFEDLSGIDQKEVQILYESVQDFFVDLKMLRPNDDKFASSRFLEGNLFTPSSISDSYLSFSETTEVMSLIYSGLNIDQIQKKKLVEQKCLPETKLLVSTKLSRDCFLRVYRDQMLQELSSLPDYVKFIQTLNPSLMVQSSFIVENPETSKPEEIPQNTFRRYFDNVLLAASQILPEQSELEVGDVFLVPFVLQYIEMLYSRFDVNHDGFIDQSESDMAYPVFKNLIGDVLKKKSIKLNDEGLNAFFRFLLYKGKVPYNNKDMIKFWLEFKVGRFFNKSWKPHADRSDIAQILADLARQVRASGLSSASDLGPLSESYNY